MNKCELCRSVARTHCESDQANLCWACDYRVHTANFLVARHSRTLLCHVCQSPTPWSAAGTKLGRTVSICDRCVRGCDHGKEGKFGCVDTGVGIESDGGSDEGGETSSDGEVDEEVDEVDNEDNQVVPWSPTTPPPAASSSSNSDAESYSSSSSPRRERRKRALQSASDLRSNANRKHFSSQENVSTPPPATESSERRGSEKNVKRRKLVESSRVGLLNPNSRAIADSVKRMHREEMRSGATVAKLFKISGGSLAVDADRDFEESSQP